MFARLRCSGNLPLCLAFGTGEGLLGYGICVPCLKRLPGVRDAFSEAFGVKNRLLRYEKGIRCMKTPFFCTEGVFRGTRCAKQASTVRKRYSVPKTGSCGTRRIFKGPQNSRLHRLWTASCPPDAFSEACRAKSSPCPPDASSVRETAPLSLFAPAHSTISFVPLTRNLSPVAPSLAPSTALGTINGPRSDVSRHKEEADPFLVDLLSKSHPDLQATR